MSRIQCPCCSYYTFPSYEDALFHFCDVCGWQYDKVAHDHPDESWGANHITLNEARENYKKFKVAKKTWIGIDRLREPRPEELPGNNG